jgi:excisionase family DNA binding protein
MSEQLLTLKQVGQRLQVSRTSVWRAINERGLRCVRFGGLVRVKETDLAAWIEKHSTTGGGTDAASRNRE